MTRYACALLALLLGVAGAPLPVVGDDENGAEPLITTMFDVSALTGGRPYFYREHAPTVDPYGATDEGLFGWEGEEYVYPLGQIDEVIERVQTEVHPDRWETVPGASMRGQGEQTLIVRARAETVAAVAAYLGRLQKRTARRVIVDLVALRLSEPQATALRRDPRKWLLDDAKMAALRAAGSAGPSVSLLALERQRAAIFSGRQRAYLGAYDVEVADSRSLSDPVVRVANLGLAASVEVVLGPRGRTAVVSLRAALTELAKARTADVGGGRVIELPEHLIARLNARSRVPVGAWALIEGHSDEGEGAQWSFALRVSALESPALGGTARGLRLISKPARTDQPLTTRAFDVAELDEAPRHRMGEDIYIRPSKWSPPEPAELGSYHPLWPADSVVELLRETIAPASWERSGASIEARNATLYARNTPDVLAAIAQQLDALRGHALWSLETLAEVVDVDADLATKLEDAPGRVIDAAHRQDLDAALTARQATRVGASRLVTLAGARGAHTAGRRVTYVADYGIKLARAAGVAEPIMQEALSGVVLDAESALTVDGESTLGVIRYTRSRIHTPMRSLSTPVGTVELPALDVFRVRAAFHAPLNQTVLLGSAGAGARRRLLLVTTRLHRFLK